MTEQQEQKPKFDNSKVIENLMSRTPDDFQEAAAFLVSAIPEELEIVEAEFHSRKVMAQGQAPYYFEFLVKVPGAKRGHRKQFNANKIMRQIRKEKKYGRVQHIRFDA